MIMILAVLTQVAMHSAEGPLPLRYEHLHSLGIDQNSSRGPVGGLTQSTQPGQGRLFGVTQFGGPDDLGVIYGMNPDGSGYETLHAFAGAEGKHPVATPSLVGDRLLAGTASEGGAHGNGAVYRVRTDGNGFQALHHFSEEGAEGRIPLAGLTPRADGRLFGSAYRGGTYDAGTLFAISVEGSRFEVLHEFGMNSLAGQNPRARLHLGSDGRLYGSTENGGIYDSGVVFVIEANGLSYREIRHLRPTIDGSHPIAGLSGGGDGVIYGVASRGGTFDGGTLFRLTETALDFRVLRHFGERGPVDGWFPATPPMVLENGRLRGAVANGGAAGRGLYYEVQADGSDWRILTDFAGVGGAPSTPIGDLALSSQGEIFGVTQGGGDRRAGTVVRFADEGAEVQVRHSFSPTGQDAARSYAPLIETRDAYLVGTSFEGGLHQRGTLFRARRDMRGYEVIHSFGPNDRMGAFPRAGVIQGADGNLYGTTTYGGDENAGVLFRARSDGQQFTLLHRLKRETEGANPEGGLVEVAPNRLIGSASEGGVHGGGVVFRLDVDGSRFSVIHAFGDDPADGLSPIGDLTVAEDGWLCGVTRGGGSRGAGSIYRVRPDGSEFTVLHDFGNDETDGRGPQAGLFLADDGFLYATCEGGGRHGRGVVLRIRPDGADYRVLHEFSSEGDHPRNPSAPLVQWHDRRLFGTTSNGGGYNKGAVFAIHPDSGEVSLIHGFGASDGGQPRAGLLLASDGALYGATPEWGVTGGGTLYRVIYDGVRVASTTKTPEGRLFVRGTGAAATRTLLFEANELGATSDWRRVRETTSDASGNWGFILPLEREARLSVFRARQ